MLKHRHFCALTLAITAIALAGCTAAAPETPAAATPSATTAPETCPTGEVDGAVLYLEVVEDERGSYCHVSANPDTLTFPTDIDERLTLDLGVSDDTIKEAQARAASWFIEEVADGPALEKTGDEVRTYFQESGVFDPTYIEDYVALWDETKTTASVITFATTGEKVELARDGEPRLQVNDLTFTKAKPAEDGGKVLPYVVLYADLTGDYRTADGQTWGVDATMRVTYALEGRELGPDGQPAGTFLGGALTSPDGREYPLSTEG
ncbi:hypothetical protein [Microbacterium sp. 77mftsu3.1]|uniref:hypothetical protein n=1 Tax=Microbacterium sp. 77mftsu3.1 TaxID=1761802 RepID=UPI00037CB4BA|nr:hypothetical protein [Microbacterium sp. 77mftsu3.1]SDH51317.1 hypothetical protein SAMN04488590_3490 [Microbacterium sp. 77mftsu3.1]